jgi:uncharacterized phage protein (TIGR01671 family)
MREIRFRAWDKKENTIRSVINLFANGHVYVDCQCNPQDRLKYHRDKTHHNLSHHLIDKDCVLMQYTELHDKNGKEIYEGDVIRLQMPQQTMDELPELDERHQVVFADGAFSFEDGMGVGNFTGNENFVEVIGNIYENPELLGGSQ